MLNNILDILSYKNKFQKLISYFKLRALIKKLKKTSLSFTLLWHLSELIKELEMICLYRNKQDSVIYSSRKYKCGENGFVIPNFNNTGIKIVVKLIDDDNLLLIECTNNEFVSNYRFKNDDWGFTHTEIDEISVDNISRIIINSFEAVLMQCYKDRNSFL